MKTCSHCHTRKALDEFHRARLGALGRAAKCKACRSAQAQDRYTAKHDHIINVTRTYRESNAEKIREKSRARYATDTGYAAAMAASAAARRAAEPERFKARRAVQTAIRKGTLRRPTSCAWCKTTTAPRLVAHHRSYAPEHWLDVEFICDRCHSRHHGEGTAA